MDVNQLFSTLELISSFCQHQNLFSGVEGFLMDTEGYALMALASEKSNEGEIVEIGSYMGRSTCWLATGSRSARRGKVYAVDHFTGSPEHQQGADVESEVLVKEGTTFEKFKENIRGIGLEDFVEPIVASSEEAVKNWDKAIRLLFIDGDHSYEESRKDFELWSPFVVDGGIIAFHDVGNAEGVTRFYKELIDGTPNCTELMQICSLAVVQKTPLD